MVRRFRDGDSEAAQELLDRFQPLIQKAFRFVRHGTVGSDPIFRGFARVYGDGNPEEGARVIADRLAFIESEELMQEIIVCFLHAARHSGNLQYGFRRDFVRRVGFLLSRRYRDVYYLEELDPNANSRASEDWAIFEERRWVLGETAGALFETLSIAERELLYRLYIRQESMRQIARDLQLSEEALRNQVNALIAQLKKAFRTSDGSTDSK